MRIDLTPPVMLPVMSMDATTSDPFWLDDNYNTGSTMSHPDKIGTLNIPIHRWISERELMAASYTPFGNFIVNIAVELTLKDGWEYTDPKDPEGTPAESNMIKLKNIDNRLDVKSLCVSSIQEARRFHRAALYRLNFGKEGDKPIEVWGVTRIPDTWVTYDDEPAPIPIQTEHGTLQPGEKLPDEKQTGEIIEIHPTIRWGKGQKQVHVPKEDFVVFVNRREPGGNRFYGIPELVAVYRILKWDQSVLKAYDKTIWQRGLGLLDVTIKGVKNDEDMKKHERKYGNPAQYASIFHTERMEVKAVEGIKPGYSITDLNQVHRYYTSAGTGFPGERMIGVQTGAVTGSETDQDNMAEIYRTITDVHDEFIKAVYEMIDPTLKNKFGLNFPINVRMDQDREANVLKTNTDTVLESAEFMKVRVVESTLGYEVTEQDKEKDIYFAEFLDNRAKARGLPTEAEEREQQQEMQEQQMEQRGNQQQGRGNQQQERRDKQVGNNRDSIIDRIKLMFPTKESAADWLLNELDASYGMTNDILKPVYGAGCSNSKLVEIRNGE
jgi:hypothetical protein